jgi:hypothetical protein
MNRGQPKYLFSPALSLLTIPTINGDKIWHNQPTPQTVTVGCRSAPQHKAAASNNGIHTAPKHHHHHLIIVLYTIGCSFVVRCFHPQQVDNFWIGTRQQWWQW